MGLIQKINKKQLMEDQLSVYFIGQSGYVLKTKRCTLYIDPYLSDYIENPHGLNDPYMLRNYPPPFTSDMIQSCDGVICTHAHVDHMDPWTLNQIKQNFRFYASEGAYEKSAFQFFNFQSGKKNPPEIVIFIVYLKFFEICFDRGNPL